MFIDQLREEMRAELAALDAALPNPGVLTERLMLAIYAYGTNTGIRAMPGPLRTATARTTFATCAAAT